MTALATLDDIAALREADELEVKSAAGRDGRGELPRDFWPTYSAFANTAGGYIVLGLREQRGVFVLDGGIVDPEKIRTQLFDQLNNAQKVSCNLLASDDVELFRINEQVLMSIRVPAASRTQKPVFVGGNPLTGTYRRLNDGDRLCPIDLVKRMLAEQAEDSRDDRVLPEYGIGDIDSSSVEAYRRLLRDARPGHPFLDHDGPDFLRKLRAWRKDRETGRSGLTVAGLLMFGRLDAIRDEFPNYTLDYQERDEAQAERWVDRVTTDGTWSGNLIDFYRLVWRKLTLGLKVPFRMIDGRRHDETSAHAALREAFVNALIHADYTDRANILIVRRPDMFGFRNPGRMRISVEQAIRGGDSDGRNRTLQEMFLLIGAGERAGSGVPKIHKGWREQHWRAPALYDCSDPSDQTRLELHMEDLLPAEVSDALRMRFGSVFDEMSPEQRVVLSAAAVETTISHARAMSLCDIHPVDMTKLLSGLVQRRCLSKDGHGRGTRYRLLGSSPATTIEAFADGRHPLLSALSPRPPEIIPQPPEFGPQPPEFGPEAPELGPQPLKLGPQPPDYVDKTDEVDPLFPGRRIPGLTLPLVDALDDLDTMSRSHLVDIAEQARGGRVPRDVMIGVIASLCERRYVTVRVLAQLLDRSEDYLRKDYINTLVRSGDLVPAFPQAPNDPRQGYTAFDPMSMQ